MEPFQNIDLGQLLRTLAIVLGVVLVIALLLAGYLVWRVRRIQLPPGADFFTALRATPFLVVLVLDLLDLSLDFFAAPLSWALLTRLGLGPLRAVTVFEQVIPGTQLIPTMTVAWVLARVWNRRTW